VLRASELRALAAALTAWLFWIVASPAPACADTIDHFALVMVWMPGLCKLESSRPECKDLSLRRYDGRNLALFALEPASVENGFANTYCSGMPSDSDLDQARQWCDLDKPRINQDIADALSEIMPVVQSCQDRGIWAKYGTCTLYRENDYFRRSIELAKDVATTQLNLKVAGAIGKGIGQDILMDAFTGEFGDNSGGALDLICRQVEGKSHLYQVKITLALSAMNHGLAKDQLWLPQASPRQHCPDTFEVPARGIAPGGRAAAARRGHAAVQARRAAGAAERTRRAGGNRAVAAALKLLILAKNRNPYIAEPGDLG
jgi:ribonuclease I